MDPMNFFGPTTPLLLTPTPWTKHVPPVEHFDELLVEPNQPQTHLHDLVWWLHNTKVSWGVEV
ncbi:hypothetical protein IC582_013262 [Cucumis melo]